MDERRVTEVYAHGPPPSFGSGYLISDSLVLTARHVVDAVAKNGLLEVRPLGAETWLSASVAWRGRCDAALLELAPSDRQEWAAERIRLGQLVTSERSPCRGLGFPWAQAEKDEDGSSVRDTEEIVGEIAPRTGLKGARHPKDWLLTIHLAGSVPSALKQGSPWAGMSGAAVFCGPLLVGLIAVDPAKFDPDRLEAVPLTAMAADADFGTLLTGDPERQLVLEAVEDLEVAEALRPPYRPLPAKVPPSFLLRSIFGVVSFRGRAEELRELSSWSDSEEQLSLALITGLGGTGKTRLVAEFCETRHDEGWLTGFLNEDASGDIARKL